MDRKMITKAALILLGTVGICRAGCGAKSLEPQCQKEVMTDPVEKVLKQLRQKTTELESYQCLVEYEVNQPWFETKTLRKGVLYYARFDKNKSKLRINFQILKQDDEKEQKYIEHFILDGVWLTHIDYQIKTHKYHQLADPNEHKDANEPRNAFELVSRNFPIIGFAKIQDLKKQFEIKLVEQGPDKGENLIQMKLKVKADSVYKDDYITIDIWIDKKLYLPVKIIAVTTEEDIYQIKLLKPKVNKGIDKRVFEFKIPKGFGKPEIIPLKKKTK